MIIRPFRSVHVRHENHRARWPVTLGFLTKISAPIQLADITSSFRVGLVLTGWHLTRVAGLPGVARRRCQRRHGSGDFYLRLGGAASALDTVLLEDVFPVVTEVRVVRVDVGLDDSGGQGQRFRRFLCSGVVSQLAQRDSNFASGPHVAARAAG